MAGNDGQPPARSRELARTRRRPRLRSRAGRLAALLAVVAALGVIVGGPGHVLGATSNTTVAVTVASATSLDASGCASGVAGKTDFGTVLPSTSNVTTSDCAVVFGSSNDTSMLRTYQQDAYGSALFGYSTGALDTGFDGDGKVTTTLNGGGNTSEAFATLVQPDGKLVLAGMAQNGGPFDIGVVRYTTAGVLDASFSGDGKVTWNASNSDAAGATLATGGSVLVCSATNSNIYVSKVTSAGAVDTTFGGGDGISDPLPISMFYRRCDIAMQADGKIVVASIKTSGDNDAAVGRWNADGTADTSFDTDGWLTFEVGLATDADFGTALEIQPDGKLLVGGMTGAAAGSYDAFVARLTSAGALDASFDGDGFARVDSNSNDFLAEMAVQPDGKILIANSKTNAAPDQVWVTRLSTAGAPDAAFDGDGTAIVSYGASSLEVEGLVVLADGRIVIAGPAGGEFFVGRLTSGGTLDTTLNGTGEESFPIGDGNPWVRDAAVGPDGAVYVGGKTWTTGWSQVDFAAIRLASVTVANYAGSWAAANLFGACLHTVAGGAAAATWALAGNGNCTTAIDANWNALSTSAVKVATTPSGTTGATANLRFGFKASASQQAGTYVAPVTFEVAAPNV